MPPESPGPSSPEDAVPADAVGRAAALDDYIGGLTPNRPAPADDGQFMSGSFSGVLDLMLLLRQAAAADPTSPDGVAMPETIGRYRILRPAGQGGFSVVWEAYDPLLRRRVALKVCASDAVLSPAAGRRFRREAELASRLVHPHIVTIHEVDEDHGRVFIVAEFCEGGSLADWLAHRPGPVSPGVAARVAVAISRAAGHAHDANIIHRDIKPANVMLVPVDAGDMAAALIPAGSPPASGGDARGFTAKLGDFGLGRQERSSDGEDSLTQLTTSGSRLGTPAWMAPEQVDHSFGDVGPATDIHAIGLVLHRMLTGRPLRAGRTDVETIREVLLARPGPADFAGRGIPPDLAAVCLKCLAPRPPDRYESAAALIDDLDRWLAGMPTRARPLSAVQRLGRVISRRPIVATVVAAAVGIGLLAGWAGIERSRERRQAAASRDVIRGQNAAAELRRGFESLRSANVAGALEQIRRTRAFDPTLADSLAAKWLERRLHGEREILLRPEGAPAVASAATSGDRKDLHCIAITSDGRAAVVGGADGRLSVLRIEIGRAAVTVTPAHDEVNDVCMSSDGRLIASVGQDGRLRWCRVEAPDVVIGETPPAGCPLYAVAFAPDDGSIYYGGEDRVLRRISVAGDNTPEELVRFQAPADSAPEIEALACTGNMVVVAHGGSLSAIDARDERLLWSWSHSADDDRGAVFHGLAISPDGTRIVAGGTDRAPGIWDATSGALLGTLAGHPNWIQACRFSGDGRFLATACRDGVVRVFDAATGEFVSRMVGHAGRVWDVDFQIDGALLSTGGDGTVRRWDRPGGASTLLRELPVAGSMIRSIREAGGENDARSCRLVAVRINAAPVIVDVATGDTQELPVAVTVQAYGVAIDRRRERVAFGVMSNRDSTPLVFSLGAALEEIPLSATPGSPSLAGLYVCWTPAGELVTSVSDGRILAWNDRLDHATELGAGTTGMSRVEAAPAGPARIAVAGRPGALLPVPGAGAPDAAPIRLDDMTDPISSLAWSPDGRRLVCGGRHGAVHAFDGATGRHLGALAPHERQVVDVAYSPDGRVVLTADAECVRISDAETLTTFDDLRPGWQIETICLAANGRFVVIGGRGPGSNPDERARLAILDLAPR